MTVVEAFGRGVLRLLPVLVCIASPACAGKAAVGSGGPVLTVAASATGRFDSNVRREPVGTEVFGGGGEILVRAANRDRAPALQLEYAVSARRSSLDNPDDGTGHRLNALAGLGLAPRLRLDMMLRASRGGVDEDLVASDEAGIVSRLELQATRALRIRGYGAQRWRELSAPEPALGRYAGIEVRHRITRTTTLLADARLEQHRPPDTSRNWDRAGLTLGVGQSLYRNVALEVEARGRDRDHDNRMVRVGEDLVPRRDRDLRYGAAVVYDDGRGTELRLESLRERRRSNDVRRSYEAERLTLSVRRRAFALGSGREPPRIDERAGSDAIRRGASAGAPLLFTDVQVAGTGVCANTASAAVCWPMSGSGAARPAWLRGGWQQIAAATGRACGLDHDGAAWCWTWNPHPSPGAAVTTDPAPVRTTLRFRQLAIGGAHACGLSTTDGSAFCWGDNGDGQLGNGLAIPAPAPVAVAGGRTWRVIVAGGRHTCALDDAGAAWCWGANESGQAGAGPLPRTPEPRRVHGPAFVALAAGGMHTCALTAEGDAWCWGDNMKGQLGSAAPGLARTPGPAAAGHAFRTLAAGPAHTCGLDRDGRAWCWGSNRDGQLGTGSADGVAHPEPRAPAGSRSFTGISASDRTCATDVEGQIYCWGGGAIGGDGPGRPRRLPLPEGQGG